MFLKTAETQTTVERKKLLFKPLLESHLLISHWLRPGNMDEISQSAGEQAQPLEGRRWKATGPKAWTPEGLKNRKIRVFQRTGNATLTAGGRRQQRLA